MTLIKRPTGFLTMQALTMVSSTALFGITGFLTDQAAVDAQMKAEADAFAEVLLRAETIASLQGLNPIAPDHLTGSLAPAAAEPAPAPATRQQTSQPTSAPAPAPAATPAPAPAPVDGTTAGS